MSLLSRRLMPSSTMDAWESPAFIAAYKPSTRAATPSSVKALLGTMRSMKCTPRLSRSRLRALLPLAFLAFPAWRAASLRVFSSSFNAASPMDLPSSAPSLRRLVQSNLLLLPMLSWSCGLEASVCSPKSSLKPKEPRCLLPDVPCPDIPCPAEDEREFNLRFLRDVLVKRSRIGIAGGGRRCKAGKKGGCLFVVQKLRPGLVCKREERASCAARTAACICSPQAHVIH